MSEEAWTRATTIAETLEDRFGLEWWDKRNVAYGIGQRPDLYALAQSATLDDKDTLNDVARQAKAASGARSGANLGSALHRILQRLDEGEEDYEVPPAWRADVDAYYAALTDAKMTVDPHWIERVVIVPQLRVAGTVDRLVQVWGTEGHFAADFKSGKNAVKYGAHDIAVQLALYANATHAWKGSATDVPRDRWKRYLLPLPEDEPDAYEPLPPVHKDKAYIIHMPVDSAQCDIYTIDIEAGFQAAQLAVDVRSWRKRDDLLTPFTPEEVIAETDPDDW